MGTPGRARKAAPRNVALALGLLLGACGGNAPVDGHSSPTGGGASASPAGGEATTGVAAAAAPAGPARVDGVLVGEVDRATIESEEPVWRTTREQASPAAEPSRALADVEPGAQVDVYLGTWCGDSRREVPRLWAALDLAGQVPFALRHVLVDRSKDAPDGLLDGADIEYVPTFIVLRDGREVGRIVESAPGGIESDLLSLLRGERTGVITGRTDL